MYTITTATTIADLAPLRQFWQHHQSHANSDFDFYHLVVESRAHLLSPCVFIVREAGDIIALLVGRIENSYVRHRLGYLTLAKLKTRQLVLIEGGHIGLYSTELWTDLYKFIDRYLITNRLDSAYFSQITIPSLASIVAEKTLSPIRFCPAKTPTNHWLLALPASLDVFLKERSRKHRYWIKRLFSILDKDFPNQWEVQRFNTEDAADRFGVFAEQIAKTTYHRRLGSGFILREETQKRLRLEASRNQLQGYVLFIKGEPAAFWHCSLYKKRLSLSSTAYMDGFRKYELGTVLLVKVFEDFCGSNSVSVDFGLGDAPYKQRFGSESYQETPLLLFSGTMRGLSLRVAHGVFQGSARALKAFSDATGATQKLKTALRRMMGSKQQKTTKEEKESL